MITRTDVARSLEYGVRTGFLQGVKAYNPIRAAFAREVPSTGAFEQYADMGDVPWPRQNGGVTGSQGTDARTGSETTGGMNAGQGITILGGEERSMVVYNADFEIAIGVTHNAINDNRAGNLEEWARGAGTNFQKHQDKLCFQALNQGDVATSPFGLCYDHLPLFDDAHIDPGAEYQTGQDNKFALALSLDNYETVRVAGSKFLSGRGEPEGLTHALLVVPPDLERIAFNIVQNPQAYDTANRENNPYAGRSRILVAPGGWLDSSAWFLLDDSQTAKPVHLQMRQAATLVVWDDENAGDGGHRYFKWHARYQVFYGAWRLAVRGNT